MLEGAAVLASWQGELYDDYEHPTAACASGCVHYAAIALHQEKPGGVYSYRLPIRPTFGSNVLHYLNNRYYAVYGSAITEDNDLVSREFVLNRVRKMLQGAS